MTTDTIERIGAACEDCGIQFQAAVARSPFDQRRILLTQRRCEPCITAFEVRIATDERKARQEAAKALSDEIWEAVCPKQYRTIEEGGLTDIGILRRDVPMLDEIVGHPLGHRGLILRGDTGAGKTRAMYRLLRTYHEMTPRLKIISMSSGEFDRSARDAAGTFALTAWFSRLSDADVVFIDDLGKGRWTPATAGQFWELVDDRTKSARPIFLTTNCSGDTLVRSIGLDKDVAEPLLRRLRENCKALVLTRKTP